ncbi:MAG: hypothetical protein OQK82_08150, partial [Candidatus Pacearchaeota archaeon]|nr:hypothetical protein [Candidatus Pacearchaeota archaeon]
MIQPIFYNDEFELLSRADYSFKPYGYGEGMSLTAIVPELTETVTGSRMYYGNFTTETFSGTMAHISAPSGSDIIFKTDKEEDFVVIWRWNSADILRLYTQQVKNQAETLISFFSALNASSKRGALIISKSGGASRTFTLDKNGGDVFAEMMAYLNELAALEIPPTDNISRNRMSAEETRELAEKSFEEFKAALQAAVDMVKESTAKKYVLILTAGSYMSTSYDKTPDDISTDITLSLFSDFYGGTGLGHMSWTGVALESIVAPVEQSAIKVFAYVTNGAQVDSFQTNGYYGSTGDRFIYSSQPLAQELTWKMFQNDELLTEFTEPLTLLPVEEPMQYARLVGSLKSMRPLAETMPTSLASTLGFIDMKYTLLALEQDALEPDVAALYEESGVPLLTSADIYPSGDEQPAIPVADWLEANPREDSNSYTIWGDKRGMILDDIDVMFEVGVPEANIGDGAAQWGNPQAEVIEAQSPQVVADAFEIAPVVTEKAARGTDRISL